MSNPTVPPYRLSKLAGNRGRAQNVLSKDIPKIYTFIGFSACLISVAVLISEPP